MFKKYIANKDTTITNAYDTYLSSRSSGANMGMSDVMQVFSLYGNYNSASVEKSRILIQFPIDDISEERSNSIIPTSGSVNFYLRLYNTPHGDTVPENCVLNIIPVSKEWTEGIGTDMINYTDLGACNWLSSSINTLWDTQGGDFDSSSFLYSSSLITGMEDIEIDVTDLVEAWIAGDLDNYGVGIMFSGTYEDGSQEISYYNKKFFARGSEFYFRRPCIEARWDASRQDDRGNFYSSTNGNTIENTIYYYNYVKGQLTDINTNTGSADINVNLYDSDTNALVHVQDIYTASRVDTGIYKCVIADLQTTASMLSDVWSFSGVQFYTGSITVYDDSDSAYNYNREYVLAMPGLRNKYSKSETDKVTFRVFARDKYWNPTIYTKAYINIQNAILYDAYYRITRVTDGEEVVEFSEDNLTNNFSKLSYDKDGNYFDYFIGELEPGFSYRIQYMIKNNDSYKILETSFTFKVEE